MIFLLQQSNISNAYKIMTKSVYALSLGYSLRQSYKLLKDFEQPWMKYDNNHPTSGYY